MVIVVLDDEVGGCELGLTEVGMASVVYGIIGRSGMAAAIVAPVPPPR